MTDTPTPENPCRLLLSLDTSARLPAPTPTARRLPMIDGADTRQPNGSH